jgi:c-di-GMP-binding flagellar brake protein YcgR
MRAGIEGRAWGSGRWHQRHEGTPLPWMRAGMEGREKLTQRRRNRRVEIELIG